MKNILRTLAAGAALIALPALAVPEASGTAQAAELTISVSGVNSGQGSHLSSPSIALPPV